MEAVSYVLRVWLEPSAHNAWRASLTDMQSNQKLYFSTPQALVSYMAESLGGVSVKLLENSQHFSRKQPK